MPTRRSPSKSDPPEPAPRIAAPGRGRPRSALAEHSILQAALQILSSEGYNALTTDRVAATARVSKSTIYRRWPTKEHLILAVFGQIPMAAPEEGANLEAELIALFGQFVRIMHGSPMKAVLPRLAAECVHNPELSSALILVNEQRRVPIRIVLNRAMRRGELAEGTDIELAIDVIQGAIAIRLYFLLDQLSDAWIRKLVRLVMDGIAAKHSTPG